MIFINFVFFLTGITQTLTQSRDVSINACSDTQWACVDGGCIPAGGKCNGTMECADGTDESFPTCRNNTCGEGFFRCTYGACVAIAAQCDDVRNCADNSDELVPICRNDVDRNICRKRIKVDRHTRSGVDCLNSKDTCEDNTPIRGQRCDGRVDCADKSDETLSTCADAVCEDPLFRCAYGGCVREDAACDGEYDCVDGSDEMPELCDKASAAGVSTTTVSTQTLCILPPYPKHGSYIVPTSPEAVPDMVIDDLVVYIQYSCDEEYMVLGEIGVFCSTGFWSADFPTCVRFCKVPQHPSVEYLCVHDGTDGYRACNRTEPEGTKIHPICRGPVYRHVGILPFMRCVGNDWSYIALCEADCGKVALEGEALVLGGHPGHQGELPWHAGVYKKGHDYQPKCGGTVISTTVIISAANCFWHDNKLQPSSEFVVTVGKLHRHWNHSFSDAQRIDIRSIRIPDHFQGPATNYQADIAFLILSSHIKYSVAVRPVCLDFDMGFDSLQLQDGNKGRIAGWGLTSENRTISSVINVVDIPYVKVERCIALAPENKRAYITSDKICAGYDNSTALCEGDSGGGLSFPEQSAGGPPRFYLRGVASLSLQESCRTRTVAVFTHLLYYKHFLHDNLYNI